eukprot:g1702.t1
MKKLAEEYGDPLLAPQPPVLKEMQVEAQRRGLWNFFLPEVCGLTVMEYAPIAELLGAYRLANVAMNCSAPDTGNMEVLEKFGTPEQKKKWLEPLLKAEIRSCFAMTEPGVASSDATNISTRIERDGDHYVINGHKWWISGAIRPECKVMIVLGKSRFDGPRHQQQSMIIVPRHTPGVKILHPMHVMGHRGDHAEIIFDNVRVPASNMILGEGRGFEIAQARLGPGRIHHCMRTIGLAEMSLAALIYRSKTRTAFGSLLEKKDSVRRAIAEARISIASCRQLCYLAACMADEKGFKRARKYIAMIKVAAPRMALEIVDEAIQVHGAHGISQYSRLADIWRGLRTLRLADGMCLTFLYERRMSLSRVHRWNRFTHCARPPVDGDTGPDIVHLNTIAKSEIAEFGGVTALFGKGISGVNQNIEKYGKFAHVPHLTKHSLPKEVAPASRSRRTNARSAVISSSL